MYLYSDMGPEEAAKMSVNGALSLYLNFVNMFQMLLSLFGNKSE
jgi:FtsH-binding integral membrane protein